MDIQKTALEQLRPDHLDSAQDAELLQLWHKVEQWFLRDGRRGLDTTGHEQAASFMLQAMRGRAVALPTGELARLAKTRSSLSQRLDMLPAEVLVEPGHVRLLCEKGGQLHLSGGFGHDLDRESVAALFHEAGIPVSASIEQWEDGDTMAPVYDLSLVRCPPVLKYQSDPAYLTKAQGHGGAMVAVPVPDAVKRALTDAGLLDVPNAEPDNLHVTLLYLGRADEIDNTTREQLRDLIANVCQEHQQLRMEVSGVGRFAAGDDGVPIYAVASAVGLSQLQADLERAVAQVVDLPAVHGWTPHLTLGYADPDSAELPAIEGAELPSWTARSIDVVFGGELFSSCPLGGQRPARKAAWDLDDDQGPDKAHRIACSADDKQIIYYLVSEPGTVDTHGHRIKAETIEDALHGYMANSREVKLEHHKTITGRAVVVEGFIAPMDLTDFHGASPPDGPIAKGSSIVGIHYTDTALWNELKAVEHGISWGGFARKVTR